MTKLLFAAVAVAGFLVQPLEAQVKVQVQKAQKIQLQPAQIIAPGYMQNPLVLVENTGVQKDLKLSDEQVKKITDLSAKHKEDVKAIGARDLKKRQEIAEATKKSLGEILMGDQAKRLKQLEVQQKGPNAFFDPNVANDLGISAEQRKEVSKTIQENNKKRAEIFKENKGNQDEIQKKMAELNRTIVGDIVKGLTPEQQTKWKGLVGEPFSGTLPQAGFGAVIRPLPINPPMPLPRQIVPKIIRP